MIRISKQSERRAVSFRRPGKPSPKTGSKKDVLKGGFKPHDNAAPDEMKNLVFIPKLRKGA